MTIRFKRLHACVFALGLFVAPANAKTISGTYTLAHDEDWSEAMPTIEAGSKIDLNGHNLTVSHLTGEYEITDSAGTIYQQLVSIESTGGAYINTGYRAKRNTRIVAHFYTGTRTSNWSQFFGAADKDISMSTGLLLRYYNNENRLNAFFCGGKAAAGDWSKTDLHVELTTEGMTLNGEYFPMAEKYTDNPYAADLCIFCGNNGGNIQRPQNCRLYSFKIYEDETLVHDFVPARRLDDDVLGLLDLASPSGAFHAKQGSGSFTAGEVTAGEVKIEPGELRVNCTSDFTKPATVSLTGSLKLVKAGSGTLTWGGGTLAETTPILVTNGIFRMGVTAENVFGKSGTIVVKGKGQFDINYASSTGGSSPVLNRTFEIEGDGPDGSGALGNWAEYDGSHWGNFLSKVTLTGDATIGGTAYIDIRGSGNGVTGPEHVLTVKNKGRFLLDKGTMVLNVKRLDCDGGVLQLCQTGGAFDSIAEGICLRNNGTYSLYNNDGNATFTAPSSVTVESGRIICGNKGSCQIAGTVTVLPNGTLTVENAIAATLKDVVNEGAITIAGSGATEITGTLSGGGAISGANVAFSGESTCWTMAANDEGFTAKVDVAGVTDPDFATALAAVEVTYTGDGTTPRAYALCPKCGLTPEAAARIDLVVLDAQGKAVKSCWLGLDEDNLVLHLNDDTGLVRTALWTGAAGDGDLGNCANWLCSNDVAAVERGLPTIDTTVTIPDGIVFNVPAEKTLNVKGIVFPAYLGGDCDWRGLVQPIDTTVDLRGHKLYLSTLSGSGEITDTTGTNFQQLVSIESTGGAYINTGYRAKRNTRIVAHFYTGKRTGSWSQFFGAGDSQNNAKTAILLRYWENDNQLNAFFCGAKRASGDWANKDIHVELTTEGLALNGEYFPMAEKYTDNPYAANLYIFSGNVGGTSKNPQNCRLYSFKIYEDETLVHDFVPARRISDGVLGLLDLASAEGAFRAKQGGGSFTAGNVTGIRHYGAASGELHVDVASDSVDNTGVALTGTLKLVKDGAGTFVAHRKNQTYSGGTQVTDGQFALWNSGQNQTDWMPSTQGTMGLVGSTIDVDNGARFNIVGNYDGWHFNFLLNGGQLESSNRPIQDVSGASAFSQTRTDWSGLGNITLTADSTYSVRYDMLQNFGTVDLGGHTLGIGFTNDKTLHWGSGIANGTIEVRNRETSASGKSWFATVAAVDARTITFDMYGQFNLAYDFSVSNYVSHTANNLTTGHMGTAALNVYGTFTPVTDFFYGCTMQDGSAIDLSARTGAWPLTSLSKTGKTTVEFASDATICVVPPRKHQHKIIDWTDHAPANLDAVSFKLPRGYDGRLEKKDDGLYLRTGLTVILL